jgi:hypothetical protein
MLAVPSGQSLAAAGAWVRSLDKPPGRKKAAGPKVEAAKHGAALGFVSYA